MILFPKERLRLLARLIGGAWPMIFAKAPEGFGSAECKVSRLRDSGGMQSVNAERFERGTRESTRGGTMFDQKKEKRTDR